MSLSSLVTQTVVLTRCSLMDHVLWPHCAELGGGLWDARLARKENLPQPWGCTGGLPPPEDRPATQTSETPGVCCWKPWSWG